MVIGQWRFRSAAGDGAQMEFGWPTIFKDEKFARFEPPNLNRSLKQFLPTFLSA